jgi:glutamyl-tRNA synthetase/nondiscriminating glutamyl-tRNA synthetase
MRVRFAPSPTGHLHVGNARTALFNWLLARGQGGTFILRIEDTDLERSTRESELGIIDDLRWLGLEWDEGPDVQGEHGPYRQSERLHLYASYATELIATRQAYYCFCPAARLEADRQADLAAGRPPRYSGRCRKIPPEEATARVESGASAVVRFKVPESGEVAFRDVVRGEVRFNIEVIGDPIIVRSDGRPQYNFAVVIDDALMEVTHVIRGEDHISNTPRQLLLYRALGFNPPQFAHLALVMGPDHTPLSKRHGATSVAEFREKGYLPEALVNYLALIGWSPGENEELLPVRELARRFSLEAVGHSAGVFDEEKLAWVNRHYMKLSDPLRIGAEAMRYFQRLGFVRRPSPAALDYLASLLPMAVGSVDRLNEIPARVRFVFDYDATASLGREDVRSVLHEAGAREVIDVLAAELSTRDRMLDRDAFRGAAARVRERTGQKGKALFHPIRVVLTGEPAGPELDLAVPAIERGALLAPDDGVKPILGCRERAEIFAATTRELDGPVPFIADRPH